MTSENQEEGTAIQCALFAIDETPLCLWDLDIGKHNMDFINSIDPGYFEHIANIHSQLLDGEEKQYAANALRLAYSQGLESLFALLCATLQAPNCVVGWLLKYRNNELDSVVKKISERRPIYSKFQVNHMSWDTVATIILSHLSASDSEKDKRIVKSFGRLWTRFASDFLNDNRSNEYNSMKHGTRAKMGGFSLALGLEDTPGVPAPPERMRTVGYSEFGSSFFVAERLHDSRNFRVRQQALNWNPENIIYGLRFVALSISNVVSFLKIANGIKENDVQFTYPSDESTFEEPWKRSTGMNIGFNSPIEEGDIRPVSKEDILSVYSQ